MNFAAFERAKQGTGASRRLRNSGRAPGIVYGGSADPQLIELDHNALWHALKKEAFHSSILDLDLAGTPSKVLLRDVQYHPFRQQVLHVDFQRVDAKTRLHMKVPLHYSGEEESDAVKVDHNLVNHVLTEVEVSCLPADLPEFIAVDLSKLTKGATLKVSELQLPKGVKLVSKGSANPVMVSVVAPAAEEEEAADATAAAGEAAATAATPAAPAAKAKAKK